MAGQVEFRYQTLGDCLIVRVAGEVASLCAPAVRDTLVGKVSAGDARLVVDLSRVDAMDVAGVSALLAAQHEAEASGGSLRVVGVGPSLQSILKCTDLLVDDDLSDALEATMETATAALRERRQVPRQGSATEVDSTGLGTR